MSLVGKGKWNLDVSFETPVYPIDAGEEIKKFEKQIKKLLQACGYKKVTVTWEQVEEL